MADVLAFAEQREGKTRGVANEVVSAAAGIASELGGSVHALAVGGPGLAAGAGELGRFGAEVVHVVEHEGLSRYVADGYARIAAEAVRAGGYGAVLFPATTQGKDLSPRVAALLDVPLAADVTALEVDAGALVATRPVYAGKAFAKVAFQANPALVSLRPNLFPAEERAAAGAVRSVDASWSPDDGSRERFVEFQAASGGAVDVAEAGIVVSGGRGMKGPENWGVLEELRDAIGNGVALGASRAVVDAGWRPHGEQVGQTGKTVAPKLYFAIGISGAIQHLAGMRTSGTIVAVNKDPEAPIFGVADYGIVGDLFEVVPALAGEIRSLRGDG